MNTFASYKKAIKVIDSCTHFMHIEGARNYVNLFFSSNSKKQRPNKYGITIYVTDKMISKMYRRLNIRLAEKEVTLE